MNNLKKINSILVLLSFASFGYAMPKTRVVNVKPKLNQKFMIKAYTKEENKLLGHRSGSSLTPADFAKAAIKDDTVKILLVNKKVAGFIVYQKDKNHKGYIEAVYLDPKYRGKGYLPLLLHDAENYFKKRKIANLELQVYAYNKGALKAFKKAGFAQKKYDKFTDLWLLGKKLKINKH